MDRKIVVLDDDPTGTQTVYDTEVITEWNYNFLEEILTNKDELLTFILTNTRAYPVDKAKKLIEK